MDARRHGCRFSPLDMEVLMGGSSSPQFSASNSSSTSTSGPNPVIAPKLENITDNFWAWYNQNGKAPGYYPNGTVAPQSAQTVAANGALWNRGVNGFGYGIDLASKTQLGDTLAGRYLDIGSNPQFQKALAVSFQPQAAQLTSEILPALDARFGGAGRTGSGAHVDSTMRAINGLQQAESNAAATAAQAAYDGERSRQQQALGLLPQMQQVDYGNIAAQAQAGANSDAQAQRQLDDANAKYRYDQTAQADWYTQMAQRLIAGYPGGQTTGSGMASGWGLPSSSGTDGLLSAFVPSFSRSPGPGSALSALAPALSLAPTMLSDRRLKSDVVKVGRLNDGQPVYRYRLAGQPNVQLGLMAQDVEKHDPDAVLTDPYGFKRVDYARATARAVPKGGLL
jgi:hypothetical protein